MWSPASNSSWTSPFKMEHSLIGKCPGEANFWCREPTTQTPHSDRSRTSAICDVQLNLMILGANLSMGILQTSQQLLWQLWCSLYIGCISEALGAVSEHMTHGSRRSKKPVLDPKCLWLKHQKAGWKQETQKYCSLVQFSCNQGIAGMETDPEKFFQAYTTRQEKKFTRLKFLEGGVTCVCCKVKPWADSTVWVIASPIGLLCLFWTCF